MNRSFKIRYAILIYLLILALYPVLLYEWIRSSTILLILYGILISIIFGIAALLGFKQRLGGVPYLRNIRFLNASSIMLLLMFVAELMLFEFRQRSGPALATASYIIDSDDAGLMQSEQLMETDKCSNTYIEQQYGGSARVLYKYINHAHELTTLSPVYRTETLFRLPQDEQLRYYELYITLSCEPVSSAPPEPDVAHRTHMLLERVAMHQQTLEEAEQLLKSE